MDYSSQLKSVRKPIIKGEKGLFQPGTAPGPGRPKGSVSLLSMLKKRLEETPVGNTRSYAEMIVEAILHDAVVKRDPKMIKLIVNYVDGMPKQQGDVDINREGIEELTAFFRKIAEPGTCRA